MTTRALVEIIGFLALAVSFLVVGMSSLVFGDQVHGFNLLQNAMIFALAARLAWLEAQ